VDLAAAKKAILAAKHVTAHPPATPAAVAAFESKHAIDLPSSYTDFLMTVCGGLDCDGSPWLYTLDQVQVMSVYRPFTYSAAEGDAILRAIAAVPAGSSPLAEMSVISLQKEGSPVGCLAIANSDGDDSVLVINGDEAGHVWRAGQLDAPEVSALYVPGTDGLARLDFQAWFTLWAPCFLGIML
jgi:hypothetical protein